MTIADINEQPRPEYRRVKKPTYLGDEAWQDAHALRRSFGMTLDAPLGARIDRSRRIKAHIAAYPSRPIVETLAGAA